MKFTLFAPPDCPLSTFMFISTVTHQMMHIYNYATVWIRHYCFLYLKNFWIHNDVIFNNQRRLCIAVSYPWNLCMVKERQNNSNLDSWSEGLWTLFLEKFAAWLGSSDRIILPVYKRQVQDSSGIQRLQRHPSYLLLSSVYSPLQWVERLIFLSKGTNSLFIYSSSEGQEKRELEVLCLPYSWMSRFSS